MDGIADRKNQWILDFFWKMTIFPFLAILTPVNPPIIQIRGDFEGTQTISANIYVSKYV